MFGPTHSKKLWKKTSFSCGGLATAKPPTSFFSSRWLTRTCTSSSATTSCSSTSTTLSTSTNKTTWVSSFFLHRSGLCRIGVFRILQKKVKVSPRSASYIFCCTAFLYSVTGVLTISLLLLLREAYFFRLQGQYPSDGLSPILQNARRYRRLLSEAKRLQPGLDASSFRLDANRWKRWQACCCFITLVVYMICFLSESIVLLLLFGHCTDQVSSGTTVEFHVLDRVCIPSYVVEFYNSSQNCRRDQLRWKTLPLVFLRFALPRIRSQQLQHLTKLAKFPSVFEMGLVTFLLHQTQYTKFVVKPNTAYLVGFAKYSDRLRFSLFSFS